ncbi:MAG TPA: MBL fold metallo-hydrolase [Acidobacteriota bacterium]|nr:MBL fold metallo-hydrolase [Acidobacteriota bacterium]
MRSGPFDITSIMHGSFRLDGGAMFGTVPKVIWAKLAPPDEDNRILLAARSMLVRTADRVLLVDAGMGDRWADKLRRIYDIRPSEDDGAGLDPASVTDVILTHLHFDHARGVFRAGPTGGPETVLRYPAARIHLQEANYETAKAPNARERASYIAEDIQRLEGARLVLHSGSSEIAPGVWVHSTNGHTRGLQWVEVRADGRTFAFPSDIAPTSRHLPLPYLMGYDISAETLLVEKDGLLRRAVEEDWVLVFSHDPDVGAGHIGRDDKGHYALVEAISL